jgi:uncharacterized protein YraI
MTEIMNARNWSLAFCSATIAVTMSIAPALAETVEVTGDGVNVRSGPGTNYGVVTVWNKGVQGNRIKQQGNWSYVVTGRVEGWISSSFVKPAGSSSGSNYEATGSIDNARYKGNGIGEIKTNGNNATIQISARGENIRPFSTIYYGSIYSNSSTLMRVNVNAFESTRIGVRFPTTGNCEISFDASKKLRSVLCQAAGVDHGRTLFTGR